MVLPLYLISSVSGYSACLCTGRTARKYRQKKVHFDFNDAIALARFAATAAHVEAESPRRVAAREAELRHASKSAREPGVKTPV